MGGGRLRRPPLIQPSILHEKIEKYIQKHTKNMQIHKNICKNVEKYMKKCYVRVGNRTLAQFAIGPLTGGAPPLGKSALRARTGPFVPERAPS